MENLLLIIVFGIFAGVFTGLIPGIHINLLSVSLLVNLSLLVNYFNYNELAIFIIVMSTIHTFINFIPSIIFGVPDSDTSLSILPGHKLVLEGKAYKALYLSALGSLFAIGYIMLIAPLLFLGLENLYMKIKPFIPYILLIVILILINLEPNLNKKFWAVVITLMAGGLGVLVLNTHLAKEPLLILFTGLFGISTLFHSLRSDTSFPQQTYEKDFKPDRKFIGAVFLGGIASTVCSITPGIGNAQAATISSLFFRNITAELFIVVLSAINTVNFVLSVFTFYLINKARNGSIVAISQILDNITFDDLKLYFLIIAIVAFIGFFLTLYLGKNIIKIVAKLNIKKINLTILILLIVLIFMINKIYGVIILFASSFLGILVLTLGVKRIHLMNVLLIPVIINLI